MVALPPPLVSYVNVGSAVIALVPLPVNTQPLASVLAPLPPLATGSTPVTSDV